MARESERLPRARRESELVVEELPDELIIYDTVQHRAHCLNRSAALVFRHCDGRTTVGEMVELLAREGLAEGREAVDATLAQLSEAGLLREAEPRGAATGAALRSRRRFLQRAAIAAGASIAYPIVKSIVAPTVAHATSHCKPATAPCTINAECCSNSCNEFGECD
jgi:hypothetical protein